MAIELRGYRIGDSYHVTVLVGILLYSEPLAYQELWIKQGSIRFGLSAG